MTADRDRPDDGIRSKKEEEKWEDGEQVRQKSEREEQSMKENGTECKK